MKNLFDFLFSYKHWFVFIFLEFVCLTMLFNYNGYQRSVYFTTANGTVGTAYSLISSVTSYLNLGDENEMLEAKNEQLRQEVLRLKSLLSEYEKDSLVNISGLAPKYEVVGAKVVGGTIHKSNNLFTINKGTEDGVREEMGVVSSNGVVGVVYMSSSHYSIVIPVINTNSRVSCKLRGTKNFGTLRWVRGRADMAIMTDVPRHAQVKKGEVVLTNGYSDIFPPGIPVGFVVGVEDSPDGMSYLLRVGLYSKFETLREVSVITNYTKIERKNLEDKADSLLNSVN